MISEQCFSVTAALQPFIRNMLVFNCAHQLNPLFVYVPCLKNYKRMMSCIDMNFEAMWFALKVGEQNKGPLNWLLM